MPSAFAKKQSFKTGSPPQYVLALGRWVSFFSDTSFSHLPMAYFGLYTLTEQSGIYIVWLSSADAGNSCCVTGGKGPPGDHLPWVWW